MRGSTWRINAKIACINLRACRAVAKSSGLDARQAIPKRRPTKKTTTTLTYAAQQASESSVILTIAKCCLETTKSSFALATGFAAIR
jgi:hypothetical protein